ncbi:coiled-coil-helix-coiled-coil-helix domain-containing protein 2-like [Stylophora pistillata]|uniref:coiled-coil-helix-coiled-coil-helix domain-containing protein 2-like n=1 Tax=Stylophora pistillata TaxID=50429 RepID=UPI000C03EE98|nr:coiled-coil-helix-coiled-coil-helix domain-containing protein 2-like [Stylophora pistillata]
MPRAKRRSSQDSSKQNSTMPEKRSPNMVQPEPKALGLFGQMASTAAGVAVGSVVGNAASEALLGGRGSTESKQQDYDLQQQNHEPCRHELQRFVECAQNQSEVTLRKDFSEALKQCKQANNFS